MNAGRSALAGVRRVSPSNTKVRDWRISLTGQCRWAPIPQDEFAAWIDFWTSEEEKKVGVHVVVEGS